MTPAGGSNAAPTELELTHVHFEYDWGEAYVTVRTAAGLDISITSEAWTPEFKTAILAAVERLVNERFAEMSNHMIVTRFAEAGEDDLEDED